jgi:hypothetical protein
MQGICSDFVQKIFSKEEMILNDDSIKTTPIFYLIVKIQTLENVKNQTPIDILRINDF